MRLQASVEELFLPSGIEQAVLCVKKQAHQRHLPKVCTVAACSVIAVCNTSPQVLKMLRTHGFKVHASQCVRYAEVQQRFEKAYVPAQPDALAVLLLLNRAHAHHKLSGMLSGNASTSFSAIFGEDSFCVPHSCQHLEFLKNTLTTDLESGLDMAASR